MLPPRDPATGSTSPRAPTQRTHTFLICFNSRPLCWVEREGGGSHFGRVQANHILIGPAVVNRDTVTVKPVLGRGPDVKTAKTTYKLLDIIV